MSTGDFAVHAGHMDIWTGLSSPMAVIASGRRQAASGGRSSPRGGADGPAAAPAAGAAGEPPGVFWGGGQGEKGRPRNGGGVLCSPPFHRPACPAAPPRPLVQPCLLCRLLPPAPPADKARPTNGGGFLFSPPFAGVPKGPGGDRGPRPAGGGGGWRPTAPEGLQVRRRVGPLPQL